MAKVKSAMSRRSGKATPIQHSLLVFDHDAGELVELQRFGTDGDAAVGAYAAKEEEFVGPSRTEIVLIGSDSLETVQLTHANYFDGTAALSPYLVGISSRGFENAWSPSLSNTSGPRDQPLPRGVGRELSRDFESPCATFRPPV